MLLIFKSLITIIIIFILDFFWIVLLNNSNYNNLVSDVQKSPLNINIPSAIIAYFIIFLSFLLIVYPSIDLDNKTNNLILLAFKYSAILGFVIFGIFNTTNYTMFENYNLRTALMDTIWGTFLYFVSVLLTLYIIRKK